MPLHLVGIARRQRAVTLPGNLCRWVADGTLAAATVPDAAAAVGPLDHARALAAIHRHIGVLPVRYGTVLADEESVRAFLDSRCEDLCRDLDRLECTSEIGLRIEIVAFRSAKAASFRGAKGDNGTVPLRPSLAGSSPLAYLALRRAQYERQDQLAAQTRILEEATLAAVEGRYLQWRRLSSGQTGVVRLAFLVERGRVDDFARRIETCGAGQPGVRLTRVGPWPPYSFV